MFPLWKDYVSNVISQSQAGILSCVVSTRREAINHTDGSRQDTEITVQMLYRSVKCVFVPVCLCVFIFAKDYLHDGLVLRVSPNKWIMLSLLNIIVDV